MCDMKYVYVAREFYDKTVFIKKQFIKNSCI